jgi:2-polyprenyl-6-methoxyphenol hydroxylase-like FAD-dependent oxidoreductase
MDQLPKIHVLIVGGGIGGLMLGLMLEKAGIDYQILERSPAHRPLGSAISLDGTVLRLFEQLG